MFHHLSKSLNALFIFGLILTLTLYISACAESPSDRYIRACVSVAATQVAKDSCHCMAPEYARVLTAEEFAALADLVEQSADIARSSTDGTPALGSFNDAAPASQAILLSALQKVQPLHSAGVCGYGTAG